MRRRAVLGLALFSLSCIEGTGDSGEGFVVERKPIAAHCTPVGSAFPSGLALLSSGSGRAVLAQFQPPSFWSLDLESTRPRARSVRSIGADSNGDGLEDGPENARILQLPFASFPPVLGELSVLRDDLALVSTSQHEQVLVFDAHSATPRSLLLETPSGQAQENYPSWPPPGETRLRTAIPTLACIFPAGPSFESSGRPIGSESRCDASRPSYLTSFTAGKAVAAGRLFVATSNLRSGVNFRPGTLLVFQWTEVGDEVRVRPDPVTPVIFTQFYNPTGVARVLTAGGRELVLVVSTGAIGASTGAGNVRSEGAVEVIDPVATRVVATIPLGFAGPSFDAPAVDPSGRIAWLGASSDRQLYAVDLRPLDDPRLYAGPGPPVVLDGLSAGFPDARVFHADAPFVLPDRVDGPPPASCAGFTHVALNAAGTEVFATDFCDGTFTRIRQGLGGAPSVPWPRERFDVAVQATPFAPSDAVGLLRAPGALRVRPGEPGLDYSGPDVIVAVGQPEAQLCALRVESE